MWHEVRNGIFFFSLWHHVGLKVFNSGAFQDRGLGMLNPYFLNVTIWMSHRTPYSINPNMKMYFCFSRLTIQFVLFSLSLSHVHPCSHAISPPGLSVHNLNDRRLPVLPATRGQLTWVVPAPPALSCQYLFLSYATCIPTPLQVISPLSIGLPQS